MAYRGSSVNRGNNRRRRQAPKRGSAPPRKDTSDDFPDTNAATDVGETVPSNPVSNMLPVANNDVSTDENPTRTARHNQGQEYLKEKTFSDTEVEAISPIGGNSNASHSAKVRDEEQQIDAENSSHRRRSGRKTRRSRKKSLFPKPPTCRTIQISRGKNPIGFYFGLARKFLLDNEMIELSGVGSALPTVIHLAEMIFESRYAQKDHIHVSMMKDSEERIRYEPKARIQIWMQRSEIFFLLVAKDVEEQKAICGEKEEMSETSYDHGSTCKVHDRELTGYENGDVNVEGCAKVAGNSFRDPKDQITCSKKAEIAQDRDREDVDSKANGISFIEKDETQKFSSEKSKEGKFESEKVDAGNTGEEDVVNWQTADGGNSYLGKLIGGESTHEGEFITARDSNEVQTFLATVKDTIESYSSGSRGSSAPAPAAAVRAASTAHAPTSAPTVASTPAPYGGNSAYDGVESGNGVREVRLPVVASHVDTSERLQTHRTGGGESSTNGDSTVGIASHSSRTTTGTPDTRQTCAIDTSTYVSAGKFGEGNNATGSDTHGLSENPSEKAVANGTSKPAGSKNSYKKAHGTKKDKRSAGRVQ